MSAIQNYQGYLNVDLKCDCWFCGILDKLFGQELTNQISMDDLWFDFKRLSYGQGKTTLKFNR